MGCGGNEDVKSVEPPSEWQLKLTELESKLVVHSSIILSHKELLNTAASVLARILATLFNIQAETVLSVPV